MDPGRLQRCWSLTPKATTPNLQELNQVQVVDARHYLPEPTELVDTMLRPQTSIVVDLSGAGRAEQDRLPASIAVGRRGAPRTTRIPPLGDLRRGPSAGHPRGSTLGEARRVRLSSFAPKSLPANEIDSTDVVLKLTDADTAAEITAQPVWRASVRFGSGPSRPFTIAERRTAHVRHRHKYADVVLPQERRFYFPPDRRPIHSSSWLHA